MILPQRSFASGELSPSLYARTDYFRYGTGAKILRNCFVKKAGGVDNRAGTNYVAELNNNSEQSRFIPFIFNQDQTYSLELSHLKMRVHKNGAPVTLTPQAITAITADNPAVLTYVGADNFAAGSSVLISGIDSNTDPAGLYYNNRIFKTVNTNAGANTFELNYNDGGAVNSTTFGAAVSSSGTVAKIYELTTTYVVGDLQDLKFAQSGDKIYLTHPSYPPRELTRISDSSWTIADISFVPSQATVTAGSVSNQGSAGGTYYEYVITAVNDNTGEESLSTTAVATATGASTLNSTNFNRITYTPAASATYNNIYKLRNGAYGFIGVSSGGTFDDIGYNPDTSDNPPTTRNPFGSAGNYPSCVAFYQQRSGFANTNNNSELVELSQIGSFKNFTKSNPTRESDVVSFSVVGAQINAVKHLVDLGNLVLFNTTGEKVAAGDASGVITPYQINVKQFSYNGSANNPAPIVIDNTALYVQAGGSVVRDFSADITVDGYKGNDLTNFSDHLFRGREIVDWCYQKLPDSIVWAVRDDGVLLSLTYIKEQQMLAWARHDFDGGFVENVCCIPNGVNYEVYLIVRRTIDGVVKRYVERMSNRQITPRKPVNVRRYYTGGSTADLVVYKSNVAEKVFCDSTLTYDGRNTDLTALMNINTTGGTGGYTADDIVNFTCDNAVFDQYDVGNEIHITNDSGTVFRLELVTYVDANNFLARPDKDITSDLTGSNKTSDWTLAVDRVEGLWHIEGLNASVLGDGYVVASPYNPAYDDRQIVVTNGAVDLPRCYGIIHVGLPFVSDIETLSIDTATPNNTTVDKRSLIKTVTLQIENTRGIFVGSRNPDEDPTNSDDELLFGLTEVKQRSFENYDSGVDLLKGKIEEIIDSSWQENGRTFIRQVDPLPMTILSISPEGFLGLKG
jgi:hypothetical protein